MSVLSILGASGVYFHFIFRCNSYGQTEYAPDVTSRFTSGAICLPMPHKKDAWLIWVRFQHNKQTFLIHIRIQRASCTWIASSLMHIYTNFDNSTLFCVLFITAHRFCGSDLAIACPWLTPGLLPKSLPVLSTESILHKWLSIENYSFRPSHNGKWFWWIGCRPRLHGCQWTRSTAGFCMWCIWLARSTAQVGGGTNGIIPVDKGNGKTLSDANSDQA